MKKKYIIIFLILVVAIAFAYKYLYHSHRNISDEKASFSLTTAKLIREYQEDENLANKKYLDKTIQIKGLVTSYNIENKTVTIDEKLFGLLNVDGSIDIKVNDSLEFKGRFLGYDELLEEAKMDQITLIK